MKAARELLRWDQHRLAEMAGLSVVSVRRYEAAKNPITESIERGIIDALERAGVVFLTEGEFADTPVSGGVLLRTSAEPDEPAAKTIYVYSAQKPPGRPSGKKDAAAGEAARRPKGRRQRLNGG